MNFSWDHAKTFIAVVDAGSLSGAARMLGQTQPTISRQIAAFEASLNATLFERTGRSVAMTKFGAELVDHIRTMALSADMICPIGDGTIPISRRATSADCIRTDISICPAPDREKNQQQGAPAGIGCHS